MNITTINKEQEIKALLIARVSDAQQRKALPAQRLRLEEYANRQGWEENKDYKYIEFDESAFHGDIRHEFFRQVVQPIKEADSNVVLVMDKTDRFSRDTNDDQKSYLANQTKKGKIELHFPNDNLFLGVNSPATDWFRLDINVALAAYYSASISDNVKRKIELKLQRKEWPGKAPVGYRNKRIDDEHTDVLVDEERADFVREVFRLRCDGWSYGAIARKLRKDGFTINSPKRTLISKSNVERILNNPFYYGIMRYNGKQYPHRYEPLIKKKVFDDSLDVSQARSQNPSKWGSLVYTFSNLMVCDGGRSMSPYASKSGVYMQCSHKKGECGAINRNEEYFIERVLQVLESIVLDETVIAQVLERVKSKFDNDQQYYKVTAEELKKTFKKLERELEIMYQDRLAGTLTLDEYEQKSHKHKVQMTNITEKLESLESEDMSFEITLPYLLELAKTAAKSFQSYKPAQKNQLLKAIVSNLVFDGKNLQITLQKPFQVIAECNKTQNWCG